MGAVGGVGAPQRGEQEPAGHPTWLRVRAVPGVLAEGLRGGRLGERGLRCCSGIACSPKAALGDIGRRAGLGGLNEKHLGAQAPGPGRLLLTVWLRPPDSMGASSEGACACAQGDVHRTLQMELILHRPGPLVGQQ